MKRFASLLSIALLLSSCRSAVSPNSPAYKDAVKALAGDQGPRIGSYDDLPIADDQLQALQQMLNDKWTYFLISMDKYNLIRDSSANNAMVKRLEYTFAKEFMFNVYRGDGTPFGKTQGTYTPRSWLEAQNVDEWKRVRGTLLVPSYLHILTVEEPGKRVVLEGYHEHSFIRADIRLAAGDARQLAFETIVFEKQGQVWRVTEYRETVWSASEL